jgi:acyl carrier protein phosphodiesterase
VNYLVHLYLAGSDPELQLGGMMGDFVKGRLPDHYPEKIRLGLQLHRQIDTLSLNSPYCRSSRQRLHPRFRHVRGIMVDIFYDHFLAVHWSQYHQQTLEGYARDVYTLLEGRADILPPGLAEVAPRMIEHNWLVSYRKRDAVDLALKRIAQRLSRPTLLAEGIVELEEHEDALFGDFAGFMEEAEKFVAIEDSKDKC